MTSAKGFVVRAGDGKHHQESPGHVTALKLLGRETEGSIMIFEQTVPAGTKSWFHLHRDSDEVVWVLEGEFTFLTGDEVHTGGPGTCAFVPRNVPHAWKNSGSEPGRFLALYTPAVAGGFIEEMFEPSDAALDERLRRYRWEVLGTNPL